LPAPAKFKHPRDRGPDANGTDPWLDVQSLNLIRRHLPADAVYAIRKLAARQSPDVAAELQAEKDAAARRGRAGKSADGAAGGRGKKTLGSRDPEVSRAADAIGHRLGISGATVKRVDRLEREAPEVLVRHPALAGIARAHAVDNGDSMNYPVID